jgi:predicted ArsR family transcriptional regulator
MTLSEMTEITGLARTSMRQRVDRLVAEGLMDRKRRRGKPGRPVDVFTLSGQGRRLFTQHAYQFAQALLEEIAHKDGEAKLRAMVDGVGRRMVDELRSRVGYGSPLERVQKLAEWFSEIGAINDVHESDTSVTVKIHTCPFDGLAGDRRILCEMERDVVRELIGAETHLNCCRPEGQTRCELQVALSGDGSDAVT